jgi:hypothetical protein
MSKYKRHESQTQPSPSEVKNFNNSKKFPVKWKSQCPLLLPTNFTSRQMKREKTNFEPQVSLNTPNNIDQLHYTSIFLIMT